uniref:Uncharacterized protein n=1 Tax=candidate division CPR3 bacterium TaxID=2268181 RepID=A0A7C4M4Z0_UNCC3
MSKTGKIIFWLVIVVFVLSSFLTYGSFYFSPQSIGQDNRVVVSPEEKQEAEDKKMAEKYGQGMQGILKKTSQNVDGEDLDKYYLEIGDIPFLILKSQDEINFDRYLNKNVKVWGEMLQGEEQMTMNVKFIDLR